MQERVRNFITKQFGNPSGVLGKFIGNGMARRNVYDAEWTVSLLNIQSHHHLLEIGFGPGVSTQLASQKASKGFVAGIDHSKTMVQAASQRNAAAIRAGLMELKQGEVASLPYSDQSFDIASIMTLYFGSEVASLFAEAGYRNIRVETAPQEDKEFRECILGIK